MKILCACEESQRVCVAFREKGHEAYSCDIQECSGGYPEWHIQDDVVKLLHLNWDMIIAFPPCTYITRAGAQLMFPKGVLNEERFEKQKAAVEFFYKIWNAPAAKICIENPVPMHCANLPKESCRIDPWEFGEPYKKRTYLWLKNLPVLLPTEIVIPKKSWVSGTKGGYKGSSKERSKTFCGIAKAMAFQWS